MIGRRDYAERKAERLARLEARAAKLRAESASRLGAADRIASAIPLGQPILVGHHSERRHRKDIDRIQRNMRRGIDAANEANAIDRRIAIAEDNAAISSDDPEAVVKLKEKLANLTASQERMKAVNKLIRLAGKKGPLAAEQALISQLGIDPITAEQLLKGDCFGNVGFADYQIRNNGAEIRRIEKRLAQLQRSAALPQLDEEIGSARLVTSENRVQLHFTGKPTDAIRTELKRSGFRWAPTEGAWQRMRTNAAISEARRIAGLT